MLLEAQDDLEVVGEADDGEPGVEATRQLRPDVVLMDVRMPRMDGIQAARRILADPGNRSRVLMLTTFDEDDYVHEALRHGASGFLLKSAPPAELVGAVRQVYEGKASLAPEITRRLINGFVQRPRPGSPPVAIQSLTDRELQVLKLIGAGKTNAEIADLLSLSEATVKTYINPAVRQALFARSITRRDSRVRNRADRTRSDLRLGRRRRWLCPTIRRRLGRIDPRHRAAQLSIQRKGRDRDIGVDSSGLTGTPMPVDRAARARLSPSWQ